MGLPVSSRLSTTSNTRSLPKLVLRAAPKSSRMREVGTHKRFHVVVTVRAEITLHSIDHIGHSHKEDRLRTFNQSVGNTAGGMGLSRADIPEQEQPDPRFLNSSQFCA